LNRMEGWWNLDARNASQSSFRALASGVMKRCCWQPRGGLEPLCGHGLFFERSKGFSSESVYEKFE